MESQDRVIAATRAVMERGGIKDVTIRRVAQELGKSTTVITHYFPSRQALVRETLAHSLDISKQTAEQIIEAADDKLWAFLEWSISEEHRDLWSAIISGHAAGLDPEVSAQVEDLLAWWDEKLQQLLEGRIAGNYSESECCDIIGVAVEGILLTASRGTPSGMSGDEVLRALVSPLLR